MWNRENREHGPNRRPVGGARPPFSSTRTVRRPWATLARHARRAERSALDLTHRCSVARSAKALSTLSDLSSPLSALAALRSAPAIVAEVGGGFTRSRQARLERSLRRRQLQLGEKRGSAIGLLAAVKAAKSWRSATAMVCLSPCTWPVLLRMKLSSSKPLSKTDSLPTSRNGWSEDLA